MNSNSILSNTRIRKPLVCDLCKSEFVTQTPVRNKCEHLELGAQLAKDGRYYEILSRNFKITLNRVGKNSKSLSTDISNTEEKLKTYYNNIRLEIDEALEMLVRGLHYKKRKLFNEIYQAQVECEYNFDRCVQYKKELHSFLNTIDKFYAEWAEKQLSQENSKETLDAFKQAYLYKIELERKKIEYESFIFSKKIEFHKDNLHELQIGKLSHVTDRILPFVQWKKIDLKSTLFLNAAREKIKEPFMFIEEFSSKNLFCSYVYKNPNQFGISKIKLVVTDPNGRYLRSKNEETFSNEFKVYKFKDLILISLYSKIGHSNLKIYDENLYRVRYAESLILDAPINNLYADDNCIFFAYNGSADRTVIYAMNWDLELVTTSSTKDHQKDMVFPYYFPNKVDQIECFDSKVYLKYENIVTVINEETGDIMKVLDIPCASDMAIDMSGFFVIFCRFQKKIFYLNLNCDILADNDLIDFPDNLKFYYNKYHRRMFFYDSSEYLLYKMKNEDKLFKNPIHWYLQVNEI